MRTWIEIDTTGIESNVRRLRKHVAPAKVLAVVKGDAYGHGLLQAGAAARRGGASMLAVGDVSEVRRLRNAGDGGRILALGPILAEEVSELLALGADIVISDPASLHAVEARAANPDRIARVHLAIDTGYGSTGFTICDVGGVRDRLRRQPAVGMTGVMSHLRTSRDSCSARRQLARFNEVACAFGPNVLRHLANSGGIALGRDFFLGAIRPGLAIYGMSARCKEMIGLLTCFTWRTRVVEVHERPRGARVGYPPGHELTRDSRLGVLPVGYAHGYPRGSQGPVMVRGRRVPIVGHVNMLSTVIDLTDCGPVAHGDTATLLGSDGSDEISASDLSLEPELIPNMFTCTTTRLVHRIWKGP